MSSLTIGRLLVGPAMTWQEQTGDVLGSVGGAVVPGARTAPQFQVQLATWAADGATDTLAARLTIRRQLRSLLNNTPLKLGAFVYVIYSDDGEQNGWYAPDQGLFTDVTSPVGLATGLWQLQQPWDVLGKRRSHREARQVWMKDLRTGLYARDYLGWILGVDFAALPALQLSVLPSGASQAANTVSGQIAAVVALPAGRDGGVCQQCQGQGDLNVLGFERPESGLNLSDVIVYDRRGNLGPFSASTYPATVLADSPTSYWRLDESSGTTAADQQSANPGTYTGGFTLSITGALTASGDNDTAVALDGTSGWVSIPTGSLLNFPGAFALEAWVNPTNHTSNHTIISKGTGSTLLWNLATGSAGKQQFRFNASMSVVTSNTAPPLGVWSHVAVVWDQAAGVVRFYLNGVPDGVLTPTNTSQPATNSVAGIGSTTTPAAFFTGDLDEVVVYPALLSAARIAAHYIAGTSSASYDSSAGLLNPQAAYGWEEVYGPDYPWSWTAGLAAADVPVVENGLIRVRYDQSAGVPGFRVDVWNGLTYLEQGKMVVERVGDSTGYCNTFVSASLVEWTPDRAVILCVLSNSADPQSRERMYITVQRGELGVTFECYPALKAAGTQADAVLQWTPALNNGVGDLNNSAVKIDAPGSVSTTIAAGSSGVNVNTFTGSGTLNVASTTGFAASGTAVVPTSAGIALVTYTAGGGGGTTLTGCTLAGGVSSGTLATGGVVAPIASGSWASGAAGAAAYAATAGSGAGTGNSGQFGALATLGANSFAGSENWAAILRCPTTYNTISAYQHTLVVQQAANALLKYGGSDSNAYGANADTYQASSQNGAGYVQCGLYFAATVAQQILEAESMTLGSGSTTTADSSASGGNAVTATRTADATHISQTNWPSAFAGTFRIFARVKTSASTLNIYAKLSVGAANPTVTTTSTSWVWLDLGELTTATNSTLQLHCWATAAATVSVDRVEAVLVQDRARTAFIYNGARDAGQSGLEDARTLGAIVAR